MKVTRRYFASWSAAAAAGAASNVTARAFDQPGQLAAKLDRAVTAPVLRAEFFKQPVKIAAVDLLRNRNDFLVRIRSTDGATGIASAHPTILKSTYPILLERVRPLFVGKDARDLEALLREVYLHNDNYKWQGLPFWVSVAAVELAVLDLLGKVAGKPVGELLGGVVRKDIAVYRASGQRGNSPEAEIEYLKKLISETGAKAIKFRLGARMQYTDESTRRDRELIPLTRKVFGAGMTIYADANGSYDVPLAIKIARIMEEHKLRFMEEPVPFDYYQETKQIADAVKIPIAGGEQDSSLRQFRWMIENSVVQIVQPDLLYFGGLIRSVRVARMAAAAGMECTAHMSGGGLGYLYILHFASCVPNAGPHQEFKGFENTVPVSSDTSPLKCESGMIRVPSGPGLGVTIDPDFLSRTKPV
jgi:L-alanine-DL-glutamate epimerase-like enolase superfamily enzyme